MTGESTRDLRDYLNIAWRRRWMIFFLTVLVTGAAGAYSYSRPDVFAANARVLLQRSQSSILLGEGISYLDPSLIATEIEIIGTPPVRALVQERLGYAPPGVTPSAVGNTSIINIRATGPDAQQAADVANAYGEAYISYRLSKTVEGLALATKELESRISSLGKAIEALDAQAAATPRPPNTPAPVNSEREALAGQQALLKQRLGDLTAAKELQEGGAQLIAPATPPATAAGASPVRHLALGVAVGLIFGMAVAFGYDYLDDTIELKEDLERAAPGIPPIGAIPSVASWKSRRDARLISREEPDSAPAEAYRTLRTSIQFLGFERPATVLQITSPAPGDGKSATAANLAVALGRAGRRVALLSCDLRRPRLHEFFGVDNEVGFTSVLLGETPLSQALRPIAEGDRTFLMPSGPIPPNPSELLSSRRTADVFEGLRKQFDFVLVDTPPVLPVTDALVVAAQVDAVLLVATRGRTSRRELARSVEMLKQVDARIAGTVLNQALPEAGYHYYRSDTYRSNGAAHSNGTKNGAAEKAKKRRRKAVKG